MKLQFLLVLALSAFASLAFGQYKYIGPDGRVVYSDTPPPPSAKDVQRTKFGGSGGAPAPGDLPFALQQVARDNPVTIFTASNCPACAQGRTLLTQRGIPYSEKTVTSSEDKDALTKVAGALKVPVLVVGNGKHIGYEEEAWGSLLDTAGYPKTSQLPPTYKNPPPVAAAPEKPQEKPAVAAQVPAKSQAQTTQTPQPQPEGSRPSWFKGF